MKKKTFLSLAQKKAMARDAKADTSPEGLQATAEKYDVSMSTVRKQLSSGTGIKRQRAGGAEDTKAASLLQLGALVQQANDKARDLGYTVTLAKARR